MHGRKECFELQTNNNLNKSTQVVKSYAASSIIIKTYAALHETIYEVADV
jgi:hypothetical protein